MSTAPPRRATALLLVLALVLPTLTAWVYFHILAGTGKPNLLQQAVYALGKVVQFSIPVVFVLFLAPRWPEWRLPSRRDLAWGAGFGLLAGAAIVALYFGALRSSAPLAEAPARIRAKLAEFGITGPAGYWALAAFLSLAHSALEEGYWRWFVFGQLRERLPLWAALLVASLGFMSHHVLVVAAYAPGQVWRGVLPASLAVALGGAVWAWQYHRSGSLVPSWLGHALVDAALFVVGADLVARGAQGP